VADPDEMIDHRPTVVCAIPLDAEAMGRLATKLGDVHLVDVRDVIDDAAAVLAPPCSPQTLGRLQSMYPSAKVVVVELEDVEHGIELGGPVTRLLDAGAQGYLTASSLDDLARQLTSVEAHTPALHRGEPLAIEASSIDDLVMRLLRERDERTATRVAAEIGADADADTTFG
jgi:hypothetical protein